MLFYTLPNEILLIIFNYCNAQDLIQLRCVCKRFYHIASEFFIKKSNNLLVTGQKSEKFRERCQPLLSSYRKKFYIHNNWKRGRYKSKIFYPTPVSSRGYLYRNCLQMTKDVILLASNMKPTYNLCAFTRTKNGSMPNNVIVGKCSTKILDIFVPLKDIIVFHDGNGSIRQWTIKSLNGRKHFNKKLLYSSRLYSESYYMDVTPQNIIKGTPKDEIEVWKYIPEENSIMDKYVIPDLNLNSTFKEYLHSIIFDPTGTKFAAGISQTEDKGRFIIYDIKKICTEKHIRAKDIDLHLLYGDQILWKEPNDIIYLNEDYIIKIDARTYKVVQKWNAPLKCTKYSYDAYGRLTCMSSDNQYAIITGTTRGKLILWDQRQSDFIQVYHNHVNVKFIDCLQFDSSHMYVAADQIYEFDFAKIY